MCLAVAAQVVKIQNEFFVLAEVEGVTMQVCTTLLPDLKVGDHVLVHAGFAIEIIDLEVARENIRIWRELQESAPGTKVG